LSWSSNYDVLTLPTSDFSSFISIPMVVMNNCYWIFGNFETMSWSCTCWRWLLPPHFFSVNI